LSAEHHSALAHHFDSLEQQHEAAQLGLWAFLLTEIMLFGAVLTGYAVFRGKYPHEFEEGSSHLNITVGAVNTAVLLGSSLAMALAVRAAQLGRARATMGFLLLTAVLGVVFLGFKAYEYWVDYQEQLIPGINFNRERDWGNSELNPANIELFFLLYFVLTGLHAIHMLIGLGILLVLATKARKGRYTTEYHTPVEIGGLYWHFVDVVWIYLFPLLYLIGTRHSL
jgi:cytochrome c oxidase subunit III